VRFPSALGAWATVLLVVWFGARRLDDPVAGLLGGVILLATLGFVGPHMARSADLDALLVLWVTAGLLAGFLYVETGGAAALVAAAAAFAAALMTKSVAALIPAPALLLHAAGRRRLGAILTDWRAWTAAAASVIPLAIFLVVRERLTPGYLTAALGAAARFGTAVDGQTGPWTYYWNELVHNGLFFPWVIVLPLSLAPVWLDAPRRRFVEYGILAVATQLIVLTMARTKSWWYPAPIYPVAALACGVGLSAFVRRAWSAGPLDRVVSVAAAAALFLLVPIGTIRSTRDDPAQIFPFRRIERFEMQWRTHLATVRPSLPAGARLRIVGGDNVAEPVFYAEAMRLAAPPMVVSGPTDARVGDYLATCNPDRLGPFEAQFTLTNVLRGGCATVLVAAAGGADVHP
jgi:4-amino-4-deoxy-L-arabinose transferase-like glycosyltransferase